MMSVVLGSKNVRGLTTSGCPPQKGTSPLVPPKRVIFTGETIDGSVLQAGQSGVVPFDDPATEIYTSKGSKIGAADRAVASPVGANIGLLDDSEASASDL